MDDSMAGPRGRRGGRVGVRDVARLAGVSTQTVSRVLNESPQIKDATRQRVLEAIAALDYRPNNAARSLGTATTRTLGVVATDVTLHGPTVAIAALAVAAREAGRWVVTAYADAADDASVDAAVAHVLGQGVDGIVLVAPHVRTRGLVERRVTDLPVVIMHGGETDRQAEASGLACNHVIELGHRRIARVSGPPDWLEEASRRSGFDHALARAELEAARSWSGDWSAASGAAIAAEVAEAVRSTGGPTAVVVANDQMALGLIAGLQSQGIDVPADVSVTGFDDNPDAGFYRPALTTVRLDVAGEARRCVAAVFGSDESLETEPPVLMIRRSTAAPHG